MASLEDFDRYVAEHGIPEEDYPAAFARWIAERPGGPAVSGRVGDEQILPEREQRDLDGVPSFLALREDEAAGP